jgi:hypothetical protein
LELFRSNFITLLGEIHSQFARATLLGQVQCAANVREGSKPQIRAPFYCELYLIVTFWTFHRTAEPR